MTMPNERTRAFIRGRDFLSRLISPYGDGIKKVPKAVREEARRVLRHFPGVHDLGNPASFDATEIDEYYKELDEKWQRNFCPNGPAGDEGEAGKSADS